jgi:hypothetical protein
MGGRQLARDHLPVALGTNAIEVAVVPAKTEYGETP